MKKVNLLLYTWCCVLFMGSCSENSDTKPDDDLTPNASSSTLIVKASANPIDTKSAATESTMTESAATASESTGEIVFTGNDILWFNGTTNEIRFKENFYQQELILSYLYSGIEFFLDDEYLFSTLVCVSDLNSQFFNVPVFYYSQIENKFYITDGYPHTSVVLGDYPDIQRERDENMQAISEEWDKFIGFLKEAEKYKD